MSSTITNYSSLININFPQPGKDNDTQEFRNNFSNIQNAFAVAGNEITDLQTNGVKLTESNDYNNSILKNAVLQNYSETVYDGGILTTSGYVTVDYTLGVYHKYQANTNLSYEFYITNWPADGNYGKLMLEVTPISSSATVVTMTNATLIGTNSFPRTYRQTTPIIYEVWTTNNGATIYAIELTSV